MTTGPLISSLVAFVTLAAPAQAGPGWTKATADIPRPRRGAAGGVIGSQIVVVAGSNPKFPEAGTATDFYDPIDEEWTSGPSLTVPRADAAGAPVGKKFFVVGGEVLSSGQNTSSVEYLDFTEKRQADWAWHTAAPLPAARSGLALAPMVGKDAIDGKDLLWAIGGVNCLEDCAQGPVEYSNRVDLYDIENDVWIPGPPMNVARMDHGVAVVHGNIYVVGGCGDSGVSEGISACTPLDSIEMYDTSKKLWIELPAMPTPRHGMHVDFFDTDVIVLAGATDSGVKAVGDLTDAVLWFDTVNNVWSAIEPAMPDPRSDVVRGYSLRLGIVVFVIGGNDAQGNFVADVDQYALRC